MSRTLIEVAISELEMAAVLSEDGSDEVHADVVRHLGRAMGLLSHLAYTDLGCQRSQTFQAQFVAGRETARGIFEMLGDPI